MSQQIVSRGRVVGPIILTLLAITALIAACAGGGVTPQSSGIAGYPPVNSVSVAGFGEASGSPDTANVQLGVSITNRDVGEAVSQSNETMAGIMEALVEFGIEQSDLQTTNFNVWQEERYDPETGTPTGERIYHVENVVNVKVRDISKVGDAIEAALGAGANQVYGLSFSVDDTSELEAEARTNAVADARVRAEQLADALGMTVGDPIIISETYAGGGPIIYDRVAAAGGFGGGEGAPPISEGQLTIGAQVYVTYQLLK